MLDIWTKSVEELTERKYTNRKERNYKHPVIQAFTIPKLAWILTHVDLKNKKILEVGGGNGYFSTHLDKISDLTVLDISESQLKHNPATNKVVGSVYDIPFEDNTFDIVLSSNLLHHLDKPENGLDEMKRVSKDKLILLEPNNFNPIIYVGCL